MVTIFIAMNGNEPQGPFTYGTEVVVLPCQMLHASGEFTKKQQSFMLTLRNYEQILKA